MYGKSCVCGSSSRWYIIYLIQKLINALISINTAIRNYNPPVMPVPIAARSKA
jgi:hypothetical protein